MKRLAALVLAAGVVAPTAPAAAQPTCTTWQNPLPGTSTVYAPDSYPSFVLLLEDGSTLEVGPVVLGQQIDAPLPVISAMKCFTTPETPTPTPTVEPTPTEVPVTPEPEPTPTPTPRPGGPSIVVVPPTPTATPTVTTSTPTPTVPPDSSPTPTPDSSPTPTPTATPETPTATPVVTATPEVPTATPTATPTTPLADTGWNTAGLLYVGGAAVLLGAGLWALSKLEGDR